MTIRQKAALAIAISTILIGIFFYWLNTRLERHFVSVLQEAIRSNADSIDMADVVDGKWELMCFSHPYDGPLQLKRYGRTYPPVANNQDGAWGFIFIESDGSYRAVSGTLESGFEFGANLACIERENSKFTYLASKRQWQHAR